MKLLINTLRGKHLEYSLKSILIDNSLFNCDKKSLYYQYTIKKSNGDKRIIYEPCPELKGIHYRLLPLIRLFPVSKYVMAYEKGCSIKQNAQKHIKARHILHIDIKDFFPTTNHCLFKDVFCKGMDYNLIESFWNAVSYNNGLPIGAPTSPFIANRILYKVDMQLGKLSIFLKYTRYADDLIFSSKRPIKKEVISKVETILKNAGFKINPEKTYFMSSRKEVTGIIIQNKRLSVGTYYKKQLKSDIYNYLTKGKGYPDVIRGKFSHLEHIEPDYAQKIKDKYKDIDVNNFLGNL